VPLAFLQAVKLGHESLPGPRTCPKAWSRCNARSADSGFPAILNFESVICKKQWSGQRGSNSKLSAWEPPRHFQCLQIAENLCAGIACRAYVPDSRTTAGRSREVAQPKLRWC